MVGRLLVIAVLASALVMPAAASGAPFVVTSTTDGTDDDTSDGICASSAAGGACTLRAAIQQANATSGADTVSLPASATAFALTVGPAGDDAAANGDLDVTEALTLTGATPGTTTIDGADLDRVLDVRAGASLDVAHLTIRGGKAPSGEAGGAIRGLGAHLGLDDVVVTKNDGVSVIAQDGPATADLTVANTSIRSNTGATSIVESQGPTALTDSAIGPNVVAGASGFPAIIVLDAVAASDITATITRTVVSGNEITQRGEGVIDFDPSLRGPLAAHLSITESAFRDNRAPAGGIGILVDPCGQGASPTDVTIRRTAFERNTGASGASAVEWAPCGGGGAAQRLDVADSLFADNVGSSRGGAIGMSGPVESVLALTRSTFSANRADNASGGNRGGALYLGAGAATVTNSTFTGNRATAGAQPDDGGGAIAVDGGTLSIKHVTLASNGVTGAATGGGLLDNVVPSGGGSAVTVTGSILAGNSDASGVSNCGGEPLASGGSNLESAATCGLGGLQGTNPLLSALADNGGSTPTRAIAATSPALDAAAAGTCPATDQRGIARPQGAGCDIGAFELVPPPASSGKPPPAPAPPPAAASPASVLDSLLTTLSSLFLAPPVLGETVNVHLVRGTVLIAVPGAKHRAVVPKGLTFVPLTLDRQIPVGSFVDTRRGVVQLTSAAGAGKGTQVGTFDAGLFRVRQARTARAVTDLRLASARAVRCAATGKRAQAARRKRVSDRVISRLRAKASGNFRTTGRYAAATVRGTRWTMTDRCDGTLTRVTRGVVVVRDLRRNKFVRVRAGKRYFARAPGAR